MIELIQKLVHSTSEQPEERLRLLAQAKTEPNVKYDEYADGKLIFVKHSSDYGGLMFLILEDQVRDEHGKPKVWVLRVPVVTDYHAARAWTFGLNPADFRPVAET